MTRQPLHRAASRALPLRAFSATAFALLTAAGGVGTAVAVGATVAVTSAIVGSMLRTLPPACVPVQVGNVIYQQCGGVYYQPQYVGSNVQYIVVNAP